MQEQRELAFVQLLEENQNIIHKVCRIYTSDPDSHKDLFQEVTLQLWRAFPNFRGDSKFSTWMYRVALNTAITLYRKNKRTPQTNPFDGIAHRLSSEPADEVVEQQMQLMYEAIKQLNDIEKALVFLYLEDKDYREIAETLGITEVNARVKMNRVKTKLRTILNP